MRRRWPTAAVLAAAALAAGCSGGDSPSGGGAGEAAATSTRSAQAGGTTGTGGPRAGMGRPTASGGTRVVRLFSDPEMIARGARVYRENCARCHGERGEGAPNWRQRGQDGKWPPPPLNGTGHTWHHPLAALRMTIRNGTLAMGGSMPPWKDKLSDEDIDAVIAWFQSQWPDEVYQAWEGIEARARRRASGG